MTLSEALLEVLVAFVQLIMLVVGVYMAGIAFTVIFVILSRWREEHLSGKRIRKWWREDRRG